MLRAQSYHHKPGMRTQTGAALAISLIMLLLLTIIGVTAMQSTTLQERMAGNARERDTAFQYAEAAIRDGERYLTNVSVGPFSNALNANGLYKEDPPSPPYTADRDWWEQSSLTWTANDSIAATVGNARYIVEELSATSSGGSLEAGVPGVARFFRVTARGVGDAGTAVVMLQSTFKR